MVFVSQINSAEFLSSGYICVYLSTISHVMAMEAINFVLVCETLMYALHKKKKIFRLLEFLFLLKS